MNRDKQESLLSQLLASVGGRQKLWESLKDTIERHPDYMSIPRKALEPK
jgi:hypothetical protein